MADIDPRIAGLLENNSKFVETYKTPPQMTQMRQGAKASPGGLLILTCLDPRVVPENFFGPNLMSAVFRNAGGRATEDVIASLTVLRTLANGSNIIVIHHTDCGMTHLTDDEITQDAEKRTPDAAAEIKKMNFGCYPASEFEETIKEDVMTLRNAKILAGVNVYGFALETETGKVRDLKI